MTRCVVLFVDDEVKIGEMVERILGHDPRLKGVECVTAATYAAAIAAYEELVGRKPPVRVVLVTDNDLDPGHTGVGLIEELVEQRHFTGPVMMVSGRLEDGVMVVAGRTVGVLAKPFERAVLCDAVAALLDRPPAEE